MVTNKYDGEDGSTSSTCSDDTNEAFLDMLGLSALDGIETVVDADENDCNGQFTDARTDTCTDNATAPIHTSIDLKYSLAASSPDVTLLEVPHRCSRYLHQPSDVAAFVIDNFLDATECQQLIHLANKLSSTGFHYVTEAAHTDNEGVTHIVKLQEANKHKLSVFEHAPTLDELWDKMKPLVLPHIGSFIRDTNCGQPLGLNPRLRVLRYDATDNDVFEPHFDATTKVGDMTSLLTVLIYLNDGGGVDFDGGETWYMDHHTSSRKGNVDTATKVTPSTGKVVVFEHDLFHSSIPLKFGAKYVLRTDILFEKECVDKPRGAQSNAEEEENVASTLLELCQQLELTEEERQALDEIGFLDLTVESLFAPGVAAVRYMLQDALEDQSAERLLKAALGCR